MPCSKYGGKRPTKERMTVKKMPKGRPGLKRPTRRKPKKELKKHMCMFCWKCHTREDN